MYENNYNLELWYFLIEKYNFSEDEDMEYKVHEGWMHFESLRWFVMNVCKGG